MRTLLILFLSNIFFIGCTSTPEKNSTARDIEVKKVTQTELQSSSTAYFASGCFWCVEAIFESVKGVKEAVSGYSGGKEGSPTYRDVAYGKTGHAEAVKVYYDPEIISYKTLVEVYYGSHDPTTVEGQHPDYGAQYRSIIFYQNEEEKEIAEKFKSDLEASGEYSDPIVTEIVPFVKFWEAEEYHQDYEKRNPNQPYVQSVSIPRLNKFKAKFPHLLKEQH